MLTKKSDNRKEMLENISGIKIDFLFYPLKNVFENFIQYILS